MASSNLDIFRAIYEAVEVYPYYARGFAALTPIKKLIQPQGVPTMGVDKYWRIYWSEEALKRFEYNFPAILRHELEHLLRDHAERCGDRHPQAWNHAADAEINDDIPDIPDWAVFPKDLKAEDGLLAEEYYNKLDIQKISIKMSGGEGSGVTGTPEDWEEGAPEDKEAVPNQEMSEELRDQIAADIRDYVKSGHDDVPKGIQVWAEARAKGKIPRISWRRFVSNRIRRIAHGRQDYTYARPSRRQDRAHRILLPGTVQYEPSMSVVIDTSGSMHGEADWIAGILRDVSRMKADACIIDCDAAVHGKRQLKSWRDVLKSKGGGGTDMRVGVEYAQNEKADIILVLTDGETPWPEVWPKNMIALVHRGDNTEVKYG